MPSLNTGKQSADRVAAAAERRGPTLLPGDVGDGGRRSVPAAFDHVEEGEPFSGVDGEGEVRSREADLLPLLLHHRWKQLPHLWTRNNWVLKCHTKCPQRQYGFPLLHRFFF